MSRSKQKKNWRKIERRINVLEDDEHIINVPKKRMAKIEIKIANLVADTSHILDLVKEIEDRVDAVEEGCACKSNHPR